MSKFSFAIKQVATCALALGLGAGAVLGQSFFQQIPLVTSVSPSSTAPAGSESSSVLITVNGANFGPSSVVVFDGQILAPPALSTSSASSLQAVVPVSAISTPHVAQIFVITQIPATATTAAAVSLPAGVRSNMAYFPVATRLASLSERPGSLFGPAQPVSLATGDINGDGFTDAVVGAQDGSIQAFLGDGAGRFTATIIATAVVRSAAAAAVSTVPVSIALADFNGDGILDVVRADAVSDGTTSSSSVSVLLGDGAGAFTGSAAGKVSGLAAGISGIIAADFNRDGFMDAGAVISGELFHNFQGDGAGGIVDRTNAAAGTQSSAVAAGDFNGDGGPDIVIADSGDNNVRFLRSTLDGPAYFALDDGKVFSVGPKPTSITVGDFNNDGFADFATANSGDGSVTIYLGDGAGNFTRPVVPTLGSAKKASVIQAAAASVRSFIVSGDFDADGNLDLAVHDGSGITIYLGDGAGFFSPAFNAPSTGAPLLALGDVNGDGYLDLLGGGGGSITVFQTASGTAGGPVASVTPASLAFGSVNIGSSSAAKTVTVSNTGTGSLTVSQVTVTGAGFVLGTNGCTSPLAASASCTISVSFTPTAVGAATGTLTVTDNSTTGGTSQTVALSGAGVGIPTASVTPASLAFGNQNTGSTSAAQSITLKNTGSAALTIGSIVGSGAPFAITNGCGATLAPGASCTVSVTFAPTAAGAASGTVTFTDNSSSGSTQTVALSGTGVSAAGPKAVIRPTSLTFGNQLVGTNSAAQTVNLSNTGTASLTISSIVASGDFGISGRTCGATLAAGANCNVSVVFRPTTAGARNGSLTFTDNSVLGATQVATLSGTGVAPVASVAPKTLTFAAQNVGTSSAAQVVTLSNTGTAALSIGSISASGDFLIGARTCGSSLAAGANCTVSVLFRPTATGARSGALTFTDNSSTGTTQVVSLTGTGILRRIAVGSSYLFFQARAGQKAPAQTVTVSNTGTSVVAFTGFPISGANAADFAVSANTCGASLAPGASCRVSLTFMSAVRGYFTGQLNVLSDAPAATVPLAGFAF